MRIKLSKSFFLIYVAACFGILGVGNFYSTDIYSPTEFNSALRRVAEAPANSLYVSDYRTQFEYRKYMGGLYKGVIADIVAIPGVEIDGSAIRKVFKEYIEVKLGVKETNNYSPFEIEGLLFKGLREDFELRSKVAALVKTANGNISDIWQALESSWKERAAMLIKQETVTAEVVLCDEISIENLSQALLGNVAGSYNSDYEDLFNSLSGLSAGDSLVIMPSSLEELIADLKVFGKSLAENKGVKIQFILRNDRLRNYPTIEDFNSIVANLKLNVDNIEAVGVGVDNPGMHLNELSKKAIEVILNPDSLLLVQGGENLIATNRINKEHFVLGSVRGDSFRQIKYFTDLYPESGEALSYVAYVPRGIDAAQDYDSERATFYDLSDLAGINIAQRQGLNSLSDQDIERISDSGAGIVLWIAPEILAETLEAEVALVWISESLRNKTYSKLEEAIISYINNKLKGEPVFLPVVFELNKYFNGELLKKAVESAGGEYSRFAYSLPGSDKWAKIYNLTQFSSINAPKIIGNMVLLPTESIDIEFFQADYYSGAVDNFVSAKGLADSQALDNKGIIINGAYFLPQSLINEFTSSNPGYAIPSDLEGLYLGFLKVAGQEEVFLPLYNKGTLVFTTDGRVLMDRVQLAGGNITGITVNGETIAIDQKVDSINNASPNAGDVVVYTPMFEQNSVNIDLLKDRAVAMLANISKGAKPNDVEEDIRNANTYEEFYSAIDPYRVGRSDDGIIFLKNLVTGLRNDRDLAIKTPVRTEDVVNLVIVGNSIIAAVNGSEEVVIPPFGYVLSVPVKILEDSNIDLNNLKDSKISLVPEVKLESEEEVFNMDEIKQAVGGVTMLGLDRGQVATWRYSDYLIYSSEAMAAEGANLASSRRTQATDFALVDDQGPRQVIGLVKDGAENEFLAVFTISGRLSGYDIKGANFADLLYIINEELPGGYRIDSLLNLDGGSSASLNYFNSNSLYTLSIPGPGPDSKVNQVRPVNSIFLIEIK